ncbi:MAG: ABC transporter permease subunit [Planctomycetes bacterium]|nr:ABC transporter permease subunit [Planctomycetota bacterium]MBI3843644.1 ABC transporter permease subunit [Planctomycetota bacterium]
MLAPSRALASAQETTARRRFVDRLAGIVVSAGGLAIIACVLGILAFIIAEVWPLARGANVRTASSTVIPADAAGAAIADEYRGQSALLGIDGVVRFVRASDGRVLSEKQLVEPSCAPLAGARTVPGASVFTAATRDGHVLLAPVKWDLAYVGSERQVTGSIAEVVSLEIDPKSQPIETYAATVDDRGVVNVAAAVSDGSLVLIRRTVVENAITGERETSLEKHATTLPQSLEHLMLDRQGANLFGTTAPGMILWWRIADGVPGVPSSLPVGDAPVTAMTFLVGDRSLVLGLANGSISVWFPVRQPDQGFVLTRIRDFPPQLGAIRLLAPSQRDKGFLAQDDKGRLGLYYSTSHRTLWTGDSPLPRATALAYAPRADGALVADGGHLVSLDVDNPHPEISLASIFGKVWYEGGERPELVWQSSGGTTDFEPKLSLVPLLVGTLKGTFYSLILAIPFGVLGAMYTSQFMHARLKRLVKPTVEIMAALPSVVLGLLAGLWLSPRIEKAFPSLFLMAIVLPLMVMAAGVSWERLPRGFRGRFPIGSDAIFFILVLAAGAALCVALSPPTERLLFGGSFPAWVRATMGLTYDQKNAVVVGIAMGFAVIPIIFTISEDAFSNVPRSLASGSLALGASRWQTVTRVVLPAASPGIFSSIMIGFGRAVGETMIVLMATGNTPILSWNPFDGFRTLSANVAVEVPEAAHGTTLYRMLFVSALLLFVFTFAINTVADRVRQRLRRRFAEA